MEEQKQPLLSSEESGWKKRSEGYQDLARSPSVRLPPPDVTVDEIRAASSYYPPPPPIPGPLLPSAAALNDQAIVFQGGYARDNTGKPSFQRQILDEVEIRQLLIDHVGHSCCWGSQPARTWKISAIEDCNVYVGTLETFIEERESVKETEPYQGGKIDGEENGAEPELWDMDLSFEFPLLFVPLKETKTRIPHSEAIIKCSGCEGRGVSPCPTCNVGQAPGHYKENQMTRCSVCFGRGLLAHKDGSDTICGFCSGKGMLPCVACNSRGLVACQMCKEQGALLVRNTALVKWRTLSTRKVAAASGAASVPDEVFHSARGVELCNTQAYQCTPAYFADSYLLNRFSSDVIADRPHIPTTAKLICERHAISVVPVTRVTMANQKKSFSFYIIGLGREVYIKNYPSKFCWGLCCCLEWTRV